MYCPKETNRRSVRAVRGGYLEGEPASDFSAEIRLTGTKIINSFGLSWRSSGFGLGESVVKVPSLIIKPGVTRTYLINALGSPKSFKKGHLDGAKPFMRWLLPGFLQCFREASADELRDRNSRLLRIAFEFGLKLWFHLNDQPLGFFCLCHMDTVSHVCPYRRASLRWLRLLFA
jgi:hypothetical protein